MLSECLLYNESFFFFPLYSSVKSIIYYMSQIWHFYELTSLNWASYNSITNINFYTFIVFVILSD